jgi:hypothetical protein
MTTEEMWDTEVCEFIKNLPDDIPTETVIQVDKDILPKKEASDK